MVVNEDFAFHDKVPKGQPDAIEKGIISLEQVDHTSGAVFRSIHRQ